jgi:hypothetical protein
MVFLRLKHGAEDNTNNRCVKNKDKFQEVANELNEEIRTAEDLAGFRSFGLFTKDMVKYKWDNCKRKLFPAIWASVKSQNTSLPSGSECETIEDWVDPAKVNSNPLWKLCVELFGMHPGHGMAAKMNIDDTLRGASQLTAISGVSEEVMDVDVTSPEKGGRPS